MASRGRAASLRSTSRGALWLAAISVVVDAANVAAASGAEVTRCPDGYTTELEAFVPGALLAGAFVAAVLIHDLVIAADYPQERLARRYLIALVLVAVVAIAWSWLILQRAPGLPCLD